jgi:hypothetical protein
MRALRMHTDISVTMLSTYTSASRLPRSRPQRLLFRHFTSCHRLAKTRFHGADKPDPRLAYLGKRIRDEYAQIKNHYGMITTRDYERQRLPCLPEL